MFIYVTTIGSGKQSLFQHIGRKDRLIETTLLTLDNDMYLNNT